MCDSDELRPSKAGQCSLLIDLCSTGYGVPHCYNSYVTSTIYRVNASLVIANKKLYSFHRDSYHMNKHSFLIWVYADNVFTGSDGANVW